MATATSIVKLLALGPNPALQRVLTFDELNLGGVNRASQLTQYVGGKGQGVALALNTWQPGCSCVAHFLGGDNGRYVEDSLARAGVAQVVQRTEADTRICTTLLGPTATTELIDPSGTVSPSELDGLLDKIDAALAQADGGGGIAAMALCGTTPPGASGLYGAAARRLAARADLEGVLLLLDGHKNVEEVLSSGRCDVLKINVDEVKALTGLDAPDDAARALLHGEAAPLVRPGALLALTDGPAPARLYSKGGAAWRLHVPRIECVNAIGAGDVATAVFAHTLAAARAAGGGAADEAAAVDAFAWGLAAACARCTHNLPSEMERAEAEELRAQVRIEAVEEVL